MLVLEIGSQNDLKYFLRSESAIDPPTTMKL